MNELIVLEIQTRDVVKPRDQFVTYFELKKQYSKIPDTDIISFIESENSLVRGEFVEYNRLYIRKKDRSYDGVGWILNCDMDSCICCGTVFSSVNVAFHCVACGNIICAHCSTIAIVTQLTELEEQTVCVLCCYGQSHVDAVLRPNREFEECQAKLSEATVPHYIPVYRPFTPQKEPEVSVPTHKPFTPLMSESEGVAIPAPSSSDGVKRSTSSEQLNGIAEQSPLQKALNQRRASTGANQPEFSSPEAPNSVSQTVEPSSSASPLQSAINQRRASTGGQKSEAELAHIEADKQKEKEANDAFKKKLQDGQKKFEDSMANLKRLHEKKAKVAADLKKADVEQDRITIKKQSILQQKENELEEQAMLKEQEALAVKEKRESVMLRRKENEQIPNAGFVVKTCLNAGRGVFVNMCSHVCVSDVVSSQGLIGCPYMIVSEGIAAGQLVDHETDDNILVYNVVVHPKYIVATAGSSFISRKQKLVTYVIAMINQTYSDNGVINDKRFSFPEVENNYIGDEVSPFNIPFGMPSFVEFDDVKITPTPGLVLKCKQNNGSKIFVNITYDNKSPNFPLAKMYHLVSAEKNIPDKGDVTIKVFDVLIHTSIWLELQERAEYKSKLLAKIVTSVGMHACGDLDPEYKTPITNNNYKGSKISVVEFSGKSLSPSALPSNAFQEQGVVNHINSPINNVSKERERPMLLKGQSSVQLDGYDRRSGGSQMGDAVPRRSLSMEAPSSSQLTHMNLKKTSASYVVRQSGPSSVASSDATEFRGQRKSPKGAKLDKEKQNWTMFLTKSEKVIAMAEVVQQKAFRVTSKRQLILTDGPRLMCVNPKLQVMTLIPWKPQCKMTNTNTCEFVGAKFVFSDAVNGAKFWIDHIDQLD